MRIYQVELTILSWEKVYQISERFSGGIRYGKDTIFPISFQVVSLFFYNGSLLWEPLIITN